jgi:hypothetical protein
MKVLGHRLNDNGTICCIVETDHEGAMSITQLIEQQCINTESPKLCSLACPALVAVKDIPEDEPQRFVLECQRDTIGLEEPPIDINKVSIELQLFPKDPQLLTIIDKARKSLLDMKPDDTTRVLTTIIEQSLKILEGK